jgi:hypothetical protein
MEPAPMKLQSLTFLILAIFPLLAQAAVDPVPVSERLRSARNARTRECNPTLTALVRARAPKNGCEAAAACERFIVNSFSELPTLCMNVGVALDRANVNLESCRQKGHYDKSCDFDSRDRAAFHELSEKIHTLVLNRMSQDKADAAACDELEKSLAANQLSDGCREGIADLLNARPAASGSASRLATLLEDLSHSPVKTAN